MKTLSTGKELHPNQCIGNMDTIYASEQGDQLRKYNKLTTKQQLQLMLKGEMELEQYEWYRKYIGGTWYQKEHRNASIPAGSPYWAPDEELGTGLSKNIAKIVYNSNI